MDYSEALRAIKDGRRVARRSWIEPGKYIYWVPASETTTPDGEVRDLVGHAMFFRPQKSPRGAVEPWLPSFDAQSGDDWYDVDE
ncbi:MW1434 family type I TA system toxin [Streptomyces sp. GC420]|uniref:Thoeris anti-defense Tad2 family protein n=1 Tax=Streptomyces sp. GC420 TaxID=2697568 RepID=UPI0014152CBE|nr:MW1434 family type I TA system toxin [Streptomyces sp. GC420]NBM18508.1 DUF2829 domain-containing protein [Streptomyces sp. GC420]